MNNHQIRDILQEIEKKEGFDRSGIAVECNIDRSYLSKFINMKEKKEATPQLISKLKKGFPRYFSDGSGNNKNNDGAEEYSIADYISLLKEDRSLLADIIKINLTAVLETLRTVAVRQEADEEIILQSLARIEGLPEKKLFQDAGKRKSQIEQAAKKLDKLTAKNSKGMAIP